MTDAEATAQAFANIAATLQLLQAAIGGAQPAAAHAPLYDLFDNGTPFDMNSRAGSSAMSIASAALSEKWDGSATKLPTFLLSLKQRAQDVKWDAPAPHGILMFPDNDGNNCNLLDSYHSISPVTIEQVRAARTDFRSSQNSRAMFSCLFQSIEGDIRSVLFEQDGNTPAHQDGPTLFKRIVDMTATSSLQVSMQAIRQLQDLDPSDYKFNIAALNTKATQLFTLATTTARALSDAERTQFLLNAYNRIKQPAVWATWVSNKIEQFDDGHLVSVNNIPVYQALMNAAVHKATKIITGDDAGTWRSTSVEEDVVAMLAAVKKVPATKRIKAEDSTAVNPDPAVKPKLPPFARHFKTSPAKDAPKFAVGDTKVFEGVTWYFCDAQHRTNIRWHKFPASECRQRTRSLNETSPVAAIGDGSTTPTVNDKQVSPTDIAAMLADCYALAADNSLAQDSIASALEALRDA